MRHQHAVLPCCHRSETSLAVLGAGSRVQPRSALFGSSPALALLCSRLSVRLCPARHSARVRRAVRAFLDAPRAGAEAAQDLSAHREVRMEAKVGVFGRGMASVKIQYFVEGQAYGLFKARPRRRSLACAGSAAPRLA